MYIFDPSQLPEFGHHYYKGDGFSYRYQLSKRLFFKSIYIPFGPNCESEEGFDNFLKHINSLHFTKVKIDLPAIYDKEKQSKVIKKIVRLGFKKANYIQDEETILVTKDDMNLPHSESNQVRYGLNRADIIIKKDPTKNEIEEMYDIYLIAAKRLEIEPKAKIAFDKLCENCLVSLAYEKGTKNLEGFLLNYFVDTKLDDVLGFKSDKLLIAMFTGLTDKGRKLKLGRAIYYQLFQAAFDEYGVDAVDFHGASRSKGRTYMSFKESFSRRFISFPGSYTITKFL